MSAAESRTRVAFMKGRRIAVDLDTLITTICGKQHIDRMTPEQLESRHRFYQSLAAKRPQFHARNVAATARALEMVREAREARS